MRVENVWFEVTGQKVHVYYDLIGRQDQRCLVNLVLRKAEDESYRYEPQGVSGDVDEGYFAGTNREIVWDITSEFPHGLEGSAFYFEVEARLVVSRGRPLKWIAAGAAVLAGGVAAYLFLSDGGESPAPSVALPDPPGRPR